MKLPDRSEIAEHLRTSFARFSEPITLAFHKFRPLNNTHVRAGVEFTKATIHGAMAVGSAVMLGTVFIIAAENQGTQMGQRTEGVLKLFFCATTCAFARRTYVHGRDGRRALREADEQVITLAPKRDQ
jgi:hypothetical protein